MRPKIASVLFTESSLNIGGQERQALHQMKALASSGVDVTLACRPNSRIGPLAASMDIPVRELPFRNSLDPFSVVGLRDLLAKKKPTACICHSGHDANNLALAARLFGKARPTLIRSKTYLAGRASANHYNRFVDCAITPSHYLRDRILSDSRIDPKLVEVVYPGVNFAKLDAEQTAELPAALAEWLSKKRGALLVQIGMLREEKGHVLLLGAMAALASRWPLIRLAMIGSGPEQQRIERRAVELGLADRIWIGESNCVAAILRIADLAVMPSLEEPLGMAQIEAAGLGVPVVASNVGGIPETISHGCTGLLASPSAGAFAQALDYALSHAEDMRRMADLARTDVRSRFSVASNLEALLSVMIRARSRQVMPAVARAPA